ncbi:MAG TPA: LD-carboxypeptidase [Acidobacteriaceae bacterium]|nr:LD-carboxypeptidase [Acidobacteriaceae bacterium]
MKRSEMATLLKPRRLKAGSTLAMVSPASAVKPERVQAGAARLEELGYRVVVMPHVLDRGPLYYAGTAADRAADLMASFADPKIDGIICARGGWGSAEILPLLDASGVRANPKVFVGYSDHTSLHMWLQREADLVTFHGPMAAADFGRENGVDLVSWNYATSDDTSWSVGASDGLRVLRPGVAQGPIVGGCLSIVAESLGTRYALPQATEPRILFLEDTGERPYKWDRMLLHLRYAGMLENVTGIVFGDMRECIVPEESDLLEQAILHALHDFAGAIAIGLRSGHVDTPNITLPLGVRVRLDLSAAENPRLHLLEAATV